MKYHKMKLRRKRVKKSKKILILMLICFIVSSVISYCGCVVLSPKIVLEEKKIVIHVGDEFKEPAVEAYANNRDVTNTIVKKGHVNEKKVGTYQIVYDVKYSIFEDKEVVSVDVIDDIDPVIELKDGTEVNVCPNKEYVEPGYSATDNYDGDVTDKVSVQNKKNEVTYEVQDSSRNKAKVVRKISYVDSDKPSVTLKGDTYITVYLNNSYDEPGYSATDNCDGDLTDKVEVSGSVNTGSVGTYTISYKVLDSSGNETIETRTVKVVEKSLIRPSGGGGGRGIVYLTFDDGPNEGTTNVILDILKEEGVSATFFVTCYGPDYLIQRMHNEGHTVALHTASHDYATVYSSETNYFADLERVSARVERLTGQKSMIIRFPGGSSNTVSRRYNSGIMTRLTQEVRARGYHYFDWNVDSNDAAGAGTSGVYSNVVNNISLNRENVVLMHDVKSTTRDAIRNIIRYGKNNGFTFRKITYDTAMVTHGVNN